MIDKPLDKPIELKEYFKNIFSNKSIKDVLTLTIRKNSSKNYFRESYYCEDTPQYRTNLGFEVFPRFLVFSVDEYLGYSDSFYKFVPHFSYYNPYTEALLKQGRVLIKMSELIHRINFIEMKSPKNIFKQLTGTRIPEKLLRQKIAKLIQDGENKKYVFEALNPNSPGWDLYFISNFLFPNQKLK
ncbi:hypothetical protein ACFLZV_06755 [Candidatus Margulisiibacteriota bacterium]